MKLTEKSIWWGMEIKPLRRPLKRFSGRLRRKTLRQNIWPGKLKVGRVTMDCRMTQGHQRMSLGKMLLQGDTIQSSTHGAQLAEIYSETSHD
jgi:hypothetical protein